MPQDLPPVLAEPHAGWVNALNNGYTVTVRINLFAVGDGGGDLCTADPAALTLIFTCLSLTHWQAIPQFTSILATLVSTTIAPAMRALLIALLVIVALA